MSFNHRSIVSRGLKGLLACALIAPPIFAQSPTNQETELFGESVDVRVVNLDVVVEQRGDRVFDLTSDDFVLRVDGEQVPIEFFSEVRGGTGVAPAPSGAGAAVSALAPGEPVGTRYLVFVDDVFTIAPYRNRVLRNIREDLTRLRPEDSMAVVAYSGDTVDLLSTWSQSPRELADVLQKAEDRPSYGLRYRSLQNLDDNFRFAGIGSSRFDRLGFGYNGYSNYGLTGRGERAYNEIGEVVTAASSTLRAFAQPEGRKVLILLSGSWPALVSTAGSFDESINYAGYASGRVFSPLIDTANLLGYTVYPVDVPGAESRFADASVSSVREAAITRTLNRDREFAREGNLLEIADQTGGRALLDGASTAVLERVQGDTRSYYSIGFTPNWQANDERHQIDIEVPGVRRAKVRMRESFTDLSRQTETTLRLESAQLFDLPVPHAGALTVQVGEPADGGWRKVVVPLAVEIPLDRVTHLPTSEGWATRLELRVAVTDDRGDRADIPVVPLVIKSEQQPSEGDKEVYVTYLKMRERPHRVLVSLFDPATGEELSTRLNVDLGS